MAGHAPYACLNGGPGADTLNGGTGTDVYYTASILLQWDLDVNGNFETWQLRDHGLPRHLQGHRLRRPVRDRCSGAGAAPFRGPPGQTTATVNVRNVAPELTQFRLTNGAGRQVNADVPFVLRGLPMTAGAGFSDPGVLDHQTATLA